MTAWTTPKKIAYYVITGLVAVQFLAPLVWAGAASVSPQGGSAQAQGYGWGNYLTLIDYGAGLWRFLGNSAFVSVVTVVLTLIVGLTGGYAFARFRFPGKNLLFILTLAIIMVPYATMVIPLYVLLNRVGLSGSLLGVALVLAVFQLPFSIFMIRISIEAIPRELDESAMVDGCTTFGALWRILVPAIKPGLITVGLYAFLASWNDFFTSLVLINDATRFPLPLAITNLRQQTMGVIDYGATEAGVVVLALPAVVLFLALQKYYVRGFMSGALKG